PGEVARRAVAVQRVLGEAALDDTGKIRRNGVPERWRVVSQDRGERLARGAGRKRPTARRHLVEDRTERELVGAEVERTSGGLLGRHVADRSEHDARLRLPREGLGQAGAALP